MINRLKTNTETNKPNNKTNKTNQMNKANQRVVKCPTLLWTTYNTNIALL